MLSLLHIENIAVIERSDISFDQGFNVLTGETGAGKSIVIDAISAILGERAYRDMIRTAGQRMNAAAEEDQIFTDGAGYVRRKIPLSPDRTFDMGINFTGISLGIKQDFFFIHGSSLFTASHPAVVPVALCGQQMFFPAQGCADSAVVIDEVARFARKRFGIFPDVRADLRPFCGIAHVHGSAENRIYAFPVCTVGDGCVRGSGASFEICTDETAAPEQDLITGFKREIAVFTPCIFRRPAVGFRTAVHRVNVVDHNSSIKIRTEID